MADLNETTSSEDIEELTAWRKAFVRLYPASAAVGYDSGQWPAEMLSEHGRLLDVATKVLRLLNDTGLEWEGSDDRLRAQFAAVLKKHGRELPRRAPETDNA